MVRNRGDQTWIDPRVTPVSPEEACVRTLEGPDPNPMAAETEQPKFHSYTVNIAPVPGQRWPGILLDTVA